MISQLPENMKVSFKELEMASHFRKAKINKKKGFSAWSVFIAVFLLTFQGQTWFQQKFMSKKDESLPGKDVIYRFLNQSTYNWKKFLLLLSSHTVGMCHELTEKTRVKVLIVDDSLFSRARSKSVELISTVFDHTTRKHVNGYQLLTLGWSDGATFIPLNFSLIACVERVLKGIDDRIDKRTSGYKRRQETLMTKPKATALLIEQALATGIEADYVLMDTWFTEEPLIKDIKSHGLNVIGMIKRGPKRKYNYQGKEYTLDRLLTRCNKNTKSSGILGSICVKMSKGTTVKIVFVRHRSNRSKWLAVLSTDCTLSDEEIIRIYGYRWEIEVFFKCNKSHLNLSKEFQCRSYDALITHTTIVFSRYILLAWEQRKNTDSKTLGYLFFEFGEDVKEINFKEALAGLMKFILEIVSSGEREVVINVSEFKNSLLSWMSTLPKYIQDLLDVFELQPESR